MGASLREVRLQLGIHKQVVSTDDSATRTMKRVLPNAGDEPEGGRVDQIQQERAEVWKNTHTMRKKYATASYVKGTESSDLQR